jgi:hypothetical protein
MTDINRFAEILNGDKIDEFIELFEDDPIWVLTLLGGSKDNALLFSSAYNSIKILKYIISIYNDPIYNRMNVDKQFLDINYYNNKGWTILTYACRNNNLEIAEYIINETNFTNINMETNESKKAIQYIKSPIMLPLI